MKSLACFRRAVRRFHENEEGLETLQIVMIIAVAAIVLIFLKAFWGDVQSWFDDLTGQILDWTE